MVAHAFFTAAIIGVFVIFAAPTIARIAPPDRDARLVLVVAVFLMVWLKFALAAIAWSAWPEMVIYNDALRYFREIKMIAGEPFAWNPITAEGPYYRASAKLGMSWVYGIILGAFAVPTLYGIVALNILFSSLGALLIGRMGQWLTGSATIGVVAFVFSSLHPECLFWIIRPARENLTLWLVPLMLWSGMRYSESRGITHIAVFVGAFVLILLTRAQLMTFGLLTIGFLLVTSLLVERRARVAAAGAALFVTGVLLAVWPAIEDQIRRAVGQSFLHIFTLDPAFWLDMLGDIDTRTFALSAEGYGGAGAILMPFVGLTVLLVAVALLKWRRIVPRGRRRYAALVALSAVAFMLGLAMMGHTNIRFRATVAPLVALLAAAGAWHLWRWIPLPPIVLRHHASTAPSKSARVLR